MFAEELGGNTNRRKQEEQRRRRRQLKQQQQRKQKQANAENLNQEQAGPATTTEKKETKVVSAEVNCGTEISSSPAETSKKPSAVSNALILRAERQTAQKQQNSARSIQAFYRSHRSNCISLKSESDALEGYLRDLLKLKVVLKERTDTEDYIPPPVTATALTQKLLYTTTTFPYKHRDKVVKLRDGKGSTESLQKLLEIVILPGIRTKDESLNPFLIWMQTLRGQLRMQNLIRLCLYVMTKESPYDKKSLEMCSDFILSITLSSNNRNIHPSILKACRSILLPPSSPKITPLLPKGDKAKKSLFFIRIGSSLDLISALRYLLLFNTGGSPIPLKSEDLRRDCVSANEREKSTFFFQTVVEAIQKSQDDFERESLLIRLVSEILTVPLLTWRVSTESLLLRDHIRHKLLVVSMIESYTKMFARTLTAGEIESIMPADISLTVCNATPTQCLLANMVEIGSSSKSLNGSDTSRIDFQSATIFYKFVALLVDAVPLGTLTTRDSVVEWFSEKGHEKAIRLSPCVMEQCRRILSSGLVRVLFHCAIDEDILKTKEILARKNERDLKHEKEFQDSGANASAVSLAAKEVTERRKSIFSSSWARKLTDGMSKVFSVDGGQTAAATAERKSRMVQISNTSTWKDKTAGSSLQSDRTVYSLDLLMVLCRLYGIVLARWGGLGGEDAVSRVQINIQGKRQKTLGTKKADACSQTLLSVLSFGTPVLQTAWALLQDKKLASSINVVIHPYKDKAQVRCFSIRPCYTGGKEEPTKKNAAALLYVFISALSHTLIVTDDTELHDLGSPLPLHQLRRYLSKPIFDYIFDYFSHFFTIQSYRNFEAAPLSSLLR
jgi:ubiquitin-protein ligase E3 C